MRVEPIVPIVKVANNVYKPTPMSFFEVLSKIEEKNRLDREIKKSKT